MIRKAWIATWPDSTGRPSDYVKLCMRVPLKDYGDEATPFIHLDVMNLWVDNKDTSLGEEKHLSLGLLDYDDLETLYRVIGAHLQSVCFAHYGKANE